VLRQGGEKKTLTVRLTRAPGEADSEVAAAASKSKGAASSKEELLGIAVEPLTQDDARDVRLKSCSSGRRPGGDRRLTGGTRLPAAAVERRSRRPRYHRRRERRASRTRRHS